MSAFAILRAAKLKAKSSGKGSVGRAIRHLDYHETSADISRPELTQFNKEFMRNPPSIEKVIERANELVVKHNKAVDEWNKEHPDKQRRHFKSNSAQFVEFVFSFSPEMEEKIERDAWVAEQHKFIKKTLLDRGVMPVRCKLDCDEETLHLHFIGLCWDKEKQVTSAYNILGEAKDLSALQDNYADQMAPFGLERGYSRFKELESVKKKARNQGKTVREYAEENNIELPKRKHHKSHRVWKAEQHALGIALERKVDSLQQTVNDLEILKSELINQDLIPERYIELVQTCEEYEKLLKIGEQIDLVIDGENVSITEYLNSIKTQDLQRIKDLENDDFDFSL